MIAESEPVAAMSVGVIIGGRTGQNRAWIESLQGLIREVMVAREGATSGLNLNVEFHVPGNILQPEFVGDRTGFFKKATSLLKVQVAVPVQSEVDPRPILVELLHSAINAADLWAIGKYRDFDAPQFHDLVDSLDEVR
ncbi:MAG: hypothetical protein KF801_06380 [Cryobacterium sp.]|nr:hypothetical protein [Cryobacterium sp.]